jgi:hypothetical protein
MKVLILTSQYEFSHGKRPSGDGFWFFKVISNIDNNKVKETVMLNGKYSECIKKIKTNNPFLVSIKVMP